MLYSSIILCEDKLKVVFVLSRPFSVSPLNGVLGVHESMQITVEFKPTTVGDHQGDLVTRYDTGQGLFTRIVIALANSYLHIENNKTSSLWLLYWTVKSLLRSEKSVTFPIRAYYIYYFA